MIFIFFTIFSCFRSAVGYGLKNLVWTSVFIFSHVTIDSYLAGQFSACRSVFAHSI